MKMVFNVGIMYMVRAILSKESGKYNVNHAIVAIMPHGRPRWMWTYRTWRSSTCKLVFMNVLR